MLFAVVLGTGGVSSDYYVGLVLLFIGIGVLALLISPVLKRFMHGIKGQAISPHLQSLGRQAWVIPTKCSKMSSIKTS